MINGTAKNEDEARTLEKINSCRRSRSYLTHQHYNLFILTHQHYNLFILTKYIYLVFVYTNKISVYTNNKIYPVFMYVNYTMCVLFGFSHP